MAIKCWIQLKDFLKAELMKAPAGRAIIDLISFPEIKKEISIFNEVKRLIK